MRFRILVYLLRLGGALLLCSWAAEARQASDQPPLSPSEVFNQLNDLSIDPGQIYVLHGAQITRDRVKIYFNRGFIGFFGKVAGETTGAFFVGDGEVLLMPPTSTEKGSLAHFTGSPVLEAGFSIAYLRFTDHTAQELMAVARPPDPDDPEQPTGFASFWNPAVHKLHPDFSLRILEDLLGERDRPYFVAQVQSASLGVFGVSVDERVPEAVGVGASRITQGTRFADIWCSFPSRASEARSDSLALGSVRIDSYKIDTRIETDNSLEGHAELQLESKSNADRLLTFLLSSRLRVAEVRDDEGRKLEVFQSRPPEDSGFAPFGDWVAVALPSPRPVGSRFGLRFTYQGNVISDVGNGVLYVGAHGDWYPNRGTDTRARYDLTFRYPDRLNLIATGTRSEQTSGDGWKGSRWISEKPFMVAGFNLGPYDSRLRKTSRTTIEVYATPEAEASLEKRHAAARSEVGTVRLPDGRVVVEPVPKMIVPLAPSALLDQVAEGAERAVRYYETLFGPFPYSRLAIAQIPGHFGQGWPELVYLPTLSFLPEQELAELGMTGKMQRLNDRAMVAHEIAHQWWGNEVGWKSAHDQWLSEGFASYAALLYLSQEKDGPKLAGQLLRGYKHDLMSKIPPSGTTIESGGPIWLGQRLSNSLNPDGYNNIVYKKACWVLHMLRVLMKDPATGRDDKFFKMLRDFVNAYHDANPSTEDFIRHVAKYTPPELDLEHNHRLDWFFDDWVYGTGIPDYKLTATTRRIGPNNYVTQGTIEQSDVPNDFQMTVPVVATYGTEKKVTLGLVTVTGEGGHFRFKTSAKPSHVAVDEDNLLAVTR
jgi:hypothetical protein